MILNINEACDYLASTKLNIKINIHFDYISKYISLFYECINFFRYISLLYFNKQERDYYSNVKIN